MRGWAWLVLAPAGAVALASPAVASAEDRLRAGVKDIALAGGYSLTLKRRNTEDVEGFHRIPHLGYFLTDERGSGWLRGNFEALAEPTVIHLRAESQSATVVGLAALGRWVFATSWSVRPFVEAGVGILGGQVDFRQTNCDVNFILQGGVGALVFVSESMAVTAGLRVHHVSNADSCSKNVGLNSGLFILGLSYFFP